MRLVMIFVFVIFNFSLAFADNIENGNDTQIILDGPSPEKLKQKDDLLLGMEVEGLKKIIIKLERRIDSLEENEKLLLDAILDLRKGSKK